MLSTVDLGEVHLGNRVVSCSEWPEISKNCYVSKAEDFEDNASQLMTCTINSAPAEDIYGNSGSRPGNEEGVEDPNKYDEIDSNLQNL